MVLVVVGSALAIGSVAVSRLAASDWHPGVTVDGLASDRATLRDRRAVLAYLAAERDRLLSHFVRMGQMTEAERVEVLARHPETTDPAGAAIDDVVIETVLRRDLETRAIDLPTPDPWLALADARTEAMAVRFAWFGLFGASGAPPSGSDWPTPPAEGQPRSATTERAVLDRVRDGLADGVAIGELVASAQRAGWQAIPTPPTIP